MAEYIYATGCLEAADLWVNRNMVPVAGTAVGIALIEVVLFIYYISQHISPLIFS